MTSLLLVLLLLEPQERWERLAYASLALDTATTCYGLHHGAREMNPLYGDECAQAAVLNASVGWLLHRIMKKHTATWPFKFTVSFRLSASVWNVYQISQH